MAGRLRLRLDAQGSDKELSAPTTLDEGSEVEINTRDFGFLPIPKRLQFSPTKAFHWGMGLNLAFAFTSTATATNLYWCQPLLIQMSQDFNVSYEEVSRIPTLVQGGYATGLLFLTPLGDLVRRRQLILILIFTCACLTIGLCVTHSVVAFEVLSYLVGVSAVTAQVLMPLTADLAPPERRASAISLVLAGLLLGILLARVLAGVIGEFAGWRAVYYFALALQFTVLISSWLVIPDYPQKNKGLTYPRILLSMAKFAVTEPLLIQCCFISFGSMASFTNFWVTLTFLLGGEPYHYSTLIIGLFGLIGVAAVAMGPVLGRLIDGLVPWYATLIGILTLGLSHAIYTIGAGLNIAPVILTTIGIDTFRQMLEVSMATRIFGIAPDARARLNAIFILSIFVGQVTGTPLGTAVFVKYGWRASGALSCGFCGWMLFVLLLRGPHCPNNKWFGWEGGFEARKKVVEHDSERRMEEPPLEQNTSEQKHVEKIDV
ncbi:MFS general substrate transporter [Cylindrobasidium torrendii FP15055 ss-10]|uniref:MFS general substrate transporter n=1 Tax=Cylindrobasidium torrendii FP15055 ss-10 TaxID=1314674 RepID=A0A0D7BL47_9AGAR|nr:MFS general substrate transporter [Cylindrobasidium torrendii FP15055 ss-10]